MRPSLQPIALSPAKFAQINSLVYDFQIIQQPKNTRESVAKKTYVVNHEIKAEKLYKRLLNPHPILLLSVYGKLDSDSDQNSSQLVDLTSHVISQFFVHVTLVSKDEKPLHGSSSSSTNMAARQKSNFLIGTTLTSGTFYTVKELNKTIIVFKLDDLGVVRDGCFKLKFDLFEFKHYNPFNGSKNVNFLTLVISSPIVIFKANEYYKESNQRIIKTQIQREIQNAGKNPIIKYLKTIKVIKYDDLEAIQKNTKESKKELRDNEKNISAESFVTSSPEIDPLDINEPLEDILDSRILDSSLQGLPQFLFDSFANSSLSKPFSSLSATHKIEDNVAEQHPPSSSSSSCSSLLSTSSNASNLSNNMVRINVPSVNDLSTHDYFKSKSSTSRKNSTENSSLLTDPCSYSTSFYQVYFDSFQHINRKNKPSSRKRTSISKTPHHNFNKHPVGNCSNNNLQNLKKLSESEMINSLKKHFFSNNESTQNGLTLVSNFLNVEEYDSDADSENSCNKTLSTFKVSLDEFDGNVFGLPLVSLSSHVETVPFPSYSSASASSSPNSSNAFIPSPSLAEKRDHFHASDVNLDFHTEQNDYNFNEFLKLPKKGQKSQQNAISLSTETCDNQDLEDDDLLTPIITPTITSFQHEILDNCEDFKISANDELVLPLQFEHFQDNLLEKFNNTDDNNYYDAIQEDLMFIEDKHTDFSVLLENKYAYSNAFLESGGNTDVV